MRTTHTELECLSSIAVAYYGYCRQQGWYREVSIGDMYRRTITVYDACVDTMYHTTGLLLPRGLA